MLRGTVVADDVQPVPTARAQQPPDDVTHRDVADVRRAADVINARLLQRLLQTSTVTDAAVWISVHEHTSNDSTSQHRIPLSGFDVTASRSGKRATSLIDGVRTRQSNDVTTTATTTSDDVKLKRNSNERVSNCTARNGAKTYSYFEPIGVLQPSEGGSSKHPTPVGGPALLVSQILETWLQLRSTSEH